MRSGSPASQSCADRKHMDSYTSTLVSWYEVTHLNPTVITDRLGVPKSQRRARRGILGRAAGLVLTVSPALVQAPALGCCLHCHPMPSLLAVTARQCNFVFNDWFRTWPGLAGFPLCLTLKMTYARFHHSLSLAPGAESPLQWLFDSVHPLRSVRRRVIRDARGWHESFLIGVIVF